MGGRWIFLLALAIAAVPVRPQLEFNITTTWNGEEIIDHDPIQLTLSGSPDGEYLELSIEAPFFNDPPAPPGPPGRPFFGLWDYEVVEAFFLNDDDQYVEIEVCPWGQHIVLLLNGQRVTIRHSLPLEVNTTRDESTWSGTARIPVGYLPQNVTKFNAYGIHGSGDNRTYESLYPASANATAPDFHALEYFSEIDLSEILPEQGSAEMSELWGDSIEGIFRYRIETTWDDQPLNHPPAEITLQGFTAGVEMNVTAPFFNDPAPEGEPGKPFYGLWDYEVVEMFFLNKNTEYLEVELGPWGEHLLLMLKGARNVLKHSLPLDYIIVERTDPVGGQPGVWRGSAMLPPDYFPPNITLMNAYAIHGTGDNREYQSLYPAPHGDPEFPVPDFHRLELFQPIDFEYQVTNNSHYSELWEEAIRSSSSSHTSLVETEEEMEAVTVLGPSDVVFRPTSAPVQPSISQSTQEEIAQAKEKEAFNRRPKPQLVSSDELRKQRVDEDTEVYKPATSIVPEVPKPKPVRIGNREFTRRRRPGQQSSGQTRPLRQPQRATLEFESQGQQLPQFQDERTSTRGQAQFQRPPQFIDDSVPQGTAQSASEGQFPFHSQDQSPASSQFPTQGQTFGNSPLQSERQPAFPVQGQDFSNQNTRQPEEPSLFEEEPSFQNQGQPQFQTPGQLPFQSQGQPPFQSQGQPPFQSQGQLPFQSQGQPPFQSQGQPPFQNQRPLFQNQGQPQFQNQPRPQVQNNVRPQFQGEIQPPFQNPNTGTFQGEGPPRFQEQGRPPIQFQEQPQFEDPSPTESPRFQDANQGVDLPGSQPSFPNPPVDVGLQETITPDVEQAVITLAEGTPALPPPHPVCFELGLVPDPDRCYAFHECVLEDGEWQMYSWRCRRGQVFDPVNVSCVRGRCARGQGTRRRGRRPRP